MILFYRIMSFFVFPLLLLFQLNKMYPDNPVVPFPLGFVFLLVSVIALPAFVGLTLPRTNKLFVSVVALECLVIFLSYEHAFFSPLSSASFYLTLLLPLLMFFFSYNLTKFNHNFPFPIIVLCMVCIFTVAFLKNHNVQLNELLTTNSGSYTILYYLPFLLCLNNRFLKVGSVVLCFITVMMSFKRGGIICLIVGLYIYIAVGVIKGTDLILRVRRLCFSILPLTLVLIGIFYINNHYDDFIFSRFSQIEELGGSGRDVIYIHVFEMIRQSSLIDLLVGHGWNTVLRDNYLGFSAHNDFLECLYDYGFLTLIAYIILYVNLVRMFAGMLKRNSRYAAPFAASIVMFLSNSMVSHILLYDWYFATFSMFWGYIIACDEKDMFSNAAFEKFRYH